MGAVNEAPAPRPFAGWRWLASFFVFYLVAEIGYSLLYRYGAIFPPRRVVLFEESQKTFLFDPILGFRLTAVPARTAVITDGAVELAGTFSGNAQGFADRKDFTPSRLPGEALRLGVFGDSFSVLVSLDPPWPQWIENERAKSGAAARLMNFSVSGGGLANWWSVLEHFVVTQDYALDGVVFAIFESSSGSDVGDLDRSFSMSDHSRGVVVGGRAPDWAPETWPRTLDEARPMMRPWARNIVSREVFERMLRGDLRPGLPRPWDTYLTRSVMHGRITPPEPGESGPPPHIELLHAGQRRLTEEMAQTCRARSWPVLVLRIPGREDLIAHTPPSEPLLEFSRLMGAHFVDGAEAYKGLTEAQIRANWYPVDGHWNQSGSDRFARFADDQITMWKTSWGTGKRGP